MEEARPPDVFLPTETVIVGDETGFHQLTVVFLHGLDRTSNHWGATWEKLLAKAGPAGASPSHRPLWVHRVRRHPFPTLRHHHTLDGGLKAA